MNQKPENDPCGPGKLQISPTRSIRLRTEIPGPVAREWIARHAQKTLPYFERFPVFPQKAHGTLIYDVDGNVLIDFSGRAGLTGYTPDHMLETLHDSVENLINVPISTNRAVVQLSERLISLVPGAEKVILFTSGWSGIYPQLHEIDPKAVISDQRQCGFGRTGKFWAWTDAPDAVLMANFAAGLPLAALVGRAALLDEISYIGEMPTALACTAALSVIDYILTNDLPRRALQIEERVRDQFAAWGHEDSVNGSGVLLNLSLNDYEAAKKVYDNALQNGLILNLPGRAGLLKFEPPLMCPEEQLNEALDVLREALDW